MLNAIKSITIGESFALSGISLGIIIVVLACIMGLIYLMSWLFRQLEKAKSKIGKKEVTTESVTESAPTGAVAPGSCGELKLTDVTERDAAMIMAIVANQTKKPLNELRFKSIKKIKE